MSPMNNPLRQYFRRPAVYLKLPSNGKYYENGVIDLPDSGELPVFPMTAIDDITARTPDALFNGSAVAEIIKSCVPNIKDPWKINSIDLDAVLIAIKNASGDGKMSMETTCPKCKEISSYDINLMAVLGQLKSGDYDTQIQFNDLKIKFKPIAYKEMNTAAIAQFEVQKTFSMIHDITNEAEKNDKIKTALTKVTELTMELLTQSIEYIDTPTIQVDSKEFILDFLRNCDKDVYINIREHNARLREATQIPPLQIKCQNCAHIYEQPFTLNVSDFFG